MDAAVAVAAAEAMKKKAEAVAVAMIAAVNKSFSNIFLQTYKVRGE